MWKWFFVVFLGFMMMGCGTTKKLTSQHKIDSLITTIWEQNHFIGFLVVDPVTKDTLYSLNAEKYFTPASTAKIFTLYTALQHLPDRIPTLKYIRRNDTLYFEGTGDPTLLHPYFKDSTAIDFLKQNKHLVWHSDNYEGNLLGPGWAVEDYQYYFQVERGALPLYGNVVTVYQADSLQVVPTFFKDKVVLLNYPLNREETSNTFYYDASRGDTVAIPYRTDSVLTLKLLENVLRKKIGRTTKLPDGEKSILYGGNTDSVYKRMMHESDNFLADQLLILSSSTLSNTLDGNKAREFILENQLSDIQQPPRWVDGSGLSRYNLFTPESMVLVLGKLYTEIPKNRLFHLFPAIEDSDNPEGEALSPSKPFVYAKSGSVGNNYSLNGYVVTKSGRTLIFSFMNNHFTKPASEIRAEVMQVLKRIRDRY
ncbi:D-alanyl-D-alanine carboxypeptidase [Aggregatimonas sangjinii]|uniref:D-alanyl-D-alanine carboxypeptidase n=1 Tax=Aggregatimonas sangjinii TaxID=2583587 RepID=A0A5B7SPH0_9FLAO|nr:D-alanyl-D-alanine carboxypeptidase [Aggregatimonas sangjinii]QCX00476.1 D-alanyl-D-alanine carboxypeptidase [Aggregatimonas sangjinii]